MVTFTRQQFNSEQLVEFDILSKKIRLFNRDNYGRQGRNIRYSYNGLGIVRNEETFKYEFCPVPTKYQTKIVDDEKFEFLGCEDFLRPIMLEMLYDEEKPKTILFVRI